MSVSPPLNSSGSASVRKLGRRQEAVLQMMNPEWISSRTKPDSMSLQMLQSLENRGLVYQNFGKWALTQAGRFAKAAIKD